MATNRLFKAAKQFKVKKTEAIVDVRSLPISTKYSREICRFIRGKKIEDVIKTDTTDTTLLTEDTQNRQLQTAQKQHIVTTPNTILPQLRQYNAKKQYAD